MNTKCVPTGTYLAVASCIFAGRPWIAGSIKNQNVRRHFKFLGRTFRTEDKSILQLRPDCEQLLHILLEKSTTLTDLHPKELAVIPAILRIAHYRDFWIRNPADWSTSSASPREQWQDFIAHIFQRYPVHPRWNSVWEIKGTLSYRERDWYCRLAQGVSLKSLEGLPDTISPRALHWSHSAPDHLTIRQSFRWGQLQTLNTSPELTEEILKSSLFSDFSHDTIWFRLFQKVSSAQHFDPKNFGLIADALKLTVRMNHWRKAAQLVDQPLPDLLNHCLKKWQSLPDHPDLTIEQIRQPGLRAQLTELSLATWEPMPDVMPFQTHVCRREGWQPNAEIIELTTHTQLLEEAKKMHHCVDSYRQVCIQKASSIFALRLIDEHGQIHNALTIEVYRPKRKIVQIRSKWNHDPHDKELEILYQWATQNNLIA